MHDALPGHPLFVRGTDLCKVLLRRCSGMVACHRLFVSCHFTHGHLASDEDEFSQVGLAGPLVGMVGARMVSADGSPGPDAVFSWGQIHGSFCAHWTAFLQHEVLQVRHPQL